MNDHNLDDLIIDTIAPKNNKTKSLLTLIALLIIVLIVAIILTKTLLKSPENTELVFEENMSAMVAPELKLKDPVKEEVAEISKPKEATPLSTIIDEKVPTTITAPQKKETVTTTVAQTPSALTQEVPTHVEKKQETITKAVKKTKPAIELPSYSKPVVKVTKPAKPVTPVKKVHTIPKKPTHIAQKKPARKIAPKPTLTAKYYVQVGSFKETPSSRFLSVITGSGFKYHVTKPDRAGYKKLLIGPYKSRAEVDKARDIVRDRIHKSAFVVQK